MAEDATECRLCGLRFAPAKDPEPTAVPQQTINRAGIRRWSPLVISLFGLVGGGQIANGQYWKGALMIAASVGVLFVPGLTPFLIVYLAAAVDSLIIGNRRARNEEIGPWDWF